MVCEDFKQIQSLVTKLNLIAGLRSQQKINTITMGISNNDITTSITRTFYNKIGCKGHSRDDLFNLTETLINDSYKMLKKYHKDDNSTNREIIGLLKTSLMNVRVNLMTNIRETYVSDQMFITKLDGLATCIQLYLNSVDSTTFDGSLLNSVDQL